MTFNEFKNEVVDRAKKDFSDARIEIRDFTKNNSVVYSGLIICQGEVNISPTIYLEDYFRLIEDDFSFDEVYENIISVYRKYRMEESFELDDIMDFERAKEFITFKLINREKNEALLKNVPYVEYLDLAIVFNYLLEENRLMDGNNSFMVTNEIMKIWGCSVDELMELSMENTPRILGLEVTNIDEFLKSITGQELEVEPEGFIPFYVVTNNRKLYGAGTLIYKDFLKAFAGRFKTGLFVVPCSVHELIIIPANDFYVEAAQNLKEIIRYVNSEELLPTDILSDNLYYYSYEDSTLSIR